MNSIYEKPKNKIHRGFVYLDDETVINSLSAIESGKIDEIVSKVNSAREGGFGAGIGAYGAKVEGAKKSTSAFEEEMVRTRTRFSVFEIWLQLLRENSAIGVFKGWNQTAAESVQSGDTIEFRAELAVAPIQTFMRLYLWFADKAKSQGHLFSQKGDDLKETKDAERIIKMFLGDHEELEEVLILAQPKGQPGPKVVLPIRMQWLISNLGTLDGEYSVVGQVERIIKDGDEYPALRLTYDVAPTPVEIQSLKDGLKEFMESAAGMGIELTDNVATIQGPAIWLEPIAIFR